MKFRRVWQNRTIKYISVSYTHLDVYKRQPLVRFLSPAGPHNLRTLPYCLLSLSLIHISDDLKNKAAGIRTFPTGFEALMKTEDINGFSNLTIEPATIDEIVVFTSKKGDDYE